MLFRHCQVPRFTDSLPFVGMLGGLVTCLSSVLKCAAVWTNDEELKFDLATGLHYGLVYLPYYRPACACAPLCPRLKAT
jgi:hypothetical protein